MFNRTIEMNVVKKRKKDTDDPMPREPKLNGARVLDLVRPSLDGFGRTAIKIMACYIAMDTARKVVVNRLSK